MEQENIVSFEVANWLHNNSIIVHSNYVYCISKVGVRAVKTKDNNVISEKTFYRGCLEKENSEWGAVAPSNDFCYAPRCFDVISALWDKGIRICLSNLPDNKISVTIQDHNRTHTHIIEDNMSLENYYKTALEEFIKNKENI